MYIIIWPFISAQFCILYALLFIKIIYAFFFACVSSICATGLCLCHLYLVSVTWFEYYTIEWISAIVTSACNRCHLHSTTSGPSFVHVTCNLYLATVRSSIIDIHVVCYCCENEIFDRYDVQMVSPMTSLV